MVLQQYTALVACRNKSMRNCMCSAPQEQLLCTYNVLVGCVDCIGESIRGDCPECCWSAASNHLHSSLQQIETGMWECHPSSLLIIFYWSVTAIGARWLTHSFHWWNFSKARGGYTVCGVLVSIWFVVFRRLHIPWEACHHCSKWYRYLLLQWLHHQHP